MPENGVVQIPHEEILTYDEITRICRCMTGLGVHKIKLTGGELERIVPHWFEC